MNNILIKHIRETHKLKCIVAMIFALIIGITTVFSTLEIGKAIDYMSEKGSVNFSAISKILVYLIIIYFADAISNLGVAIISNKLAFSTATHLRKTLFNKLVKLPLAYIDKTPHGDILSNFTNDVDNISSAMSAALTHLITGVTTVILLLIAMFLLDFRLALIILFMTPLTFLVSKIVAKASQSTFDSQQDKLANITGFITENIGNQKTINALNNQSEVLKRFQKMNKKYQGISIKANFAAAMINPSARIVDHFSYLFVGVVGAFLAINYGVSVGVVSTFLIFSGQFSKPFNELSSIMGQIQTARSSFYRINNTLAQKEEPANINDAIEIREPEGRVEFNNVYFSYNQGSPLIEALSIKAEPGEIVAIVGPTGAGKTTIVNLLMRFYEISSGSISLDKNNITTLTMESLRKSFGMVLQDTWLFKGTIKENIAYGKPDATVKEIEKAVESAYITKFIDNLPGKYNFMIEENGANLSEGEKQLVTIARVMLTNPAILILDEATSSIDTLTEIRVQKAFLQLMHNRTSFVIAHRLSTIKKADKIMVLDNGKVVEIGTHNELISNKGLYFELYESQYK